MEPVKRKWARGVLAVRFPDGGINVAMEDWPMVVWRPDAVSLAMAARGRADERRKEIDDYRLAILLREIGPGQRMPIDYCGAGLAVTGGVDRVTVEVRA